MQEGQDNRMVFRACSMDHQAGRHQCLNPDIGGLHAELIKRMCDVLKLETQKMCSGAHPFSTGLCSDDGLWILLLELQQVYTVSKTAFGYTGIT